MLRARRLVKLYQRSRPTADMRLQCLDIRLARTATLSNYTILHNCSMSSESMSGMPIETTENMKKLLAELDMYRETGKWRQAIKLLDRVDKDEALPALNSIMYERTIAACARMGKVEVLPGLLNNMLVDNLTPTSATIDFIVQAYLAKEHWGHIVQLGNEVSAMGVEPSPAALYAIMEACGQAKDANSAFLIMKQLRKAGMKLTEDYYAAAIRAAGMARRPDTAMALFVQMEKIHDLQDNGQVLSQLIRAQVINGQLEEALQSFTTASLRRLCLNETIYTSTIDSLVSSGKHWQATRLFEQMLQSGENQPSIFCLCRAMLAYIGANRSQHAWACWKKIVETNEPNPNPIKYNKLMQGLNHVKDTQLAVSVFDHLRNLFEPGQIHQGTYAVVIRAHGRLGNAQKAVDLFDEYVDSCKGSRRLSRHTGIYLALFNALSRDKVRDPTLITNDAKRAWHLMLTNVPVVLPPAYASLAGVFASTGEMAMLKELIDHAERKWCGMADVSHHEELRYKNNDELEAFVDFEGHDTDVESKNDVLLFNGIISGLCKARDDQTANIEAYLNTMLSRQLPITDSIVRATTDACIRFENWNLMRKLLQMINLDVLKNAEVCAGDTVSKLLEAEKWNLGREWLMYCHRHDLHPLIRRKVDLLQEMRKKQSKEWQIAYTLAIETLSFRRVEQRGIDTVVDATEICKNADRMDLVIKLFDAAASHSSVQYYLNHIRQVKAGRDAMQPLKSRMKPITIPLSLYKDVILALLQHERMRGDNFDDEMRLNKAEQICRQMLEVHGKNLDGEALSLAISIKATIGDHDDVGALFQSMRALGLKPNSYAQNAAIVAFSRLRLTDQVLSIRDDLMSNRDENGEIMMVESNVAKSLLFSLALAHEDDALLDAVKNLPGCTVEMALNALLKANRNAKAVELYDASASIDVFDTVFHRLCQSGNSILAATLVLKHARLNGLNQIHSNRVIRVTNALIEEGKLVEAEQLLQMYMDDKHGLSLKQTQPYFQQHVIEMLLFIYGEFGLFNAMRALFEKELLTFPLNVAHYEVAMEYCAESRDEIAGAVASLQLFEKLRTRGFTQPSGNAYLLTLQSCLRLERLEPANSTAAKSTGQIILNDVRENGFDKEVADELAKQVASAIEQVRDNNRKVFRRIRKDKDLIGCGVIKPDELARIALFCHRHGLPMTTNLANDLLRLHKHMPAMIANELAFVKRSLEEGLGVVSAPNLRSGNNLANRVGKTRRAMTPKPKRKPAVYAPHFSQRRLRSKSYDAAVRASTDARWGVVLQPIVADRE
ncbi:putative tetratricopeptide-like helical domain superfamily [Plasmopara halstedii]